MHGTQLETTTFPKNFGLQYIGRASEVDAATLPRVRAPHRRFDQRDSVTEREFGSGTDLMIDERIADSARSSPTSTCYEFLLKVFNNSGKSREKS